MLVDRRPVAFYSRWQEPGEDGVFLFNGRESHPRSLVKAVSWRTLGSIDTFLLGLFFTHDAAMAGSIAGTEVVTKILLYYFHERMWALVKWGHGPRTPEDAAIATTGVRPESAPQG